MENKKYVFLANNFSVIAEYDGQIKDIPVYKSLLSDGTQNNIKLPDEINEEYDGLGMGTKTIKTYYSSFEFANQAKVKIALPEGTKSISVKPEKFKNKVKYENGTAIFETASTAYLAIEPDGDIFGAIHVFCNKKQAVSFDKHNIIEFTEGIYTADNSDYIRINEHGVPVIDCVKDDTLIYIGVNAVVNAAIELIGVSNVKIAGTGTISLIDRCHGADEAFEGERYWGAFRYYAKPNILIRSGCTNIEIDDVLLNCEFRGIVIRNSEDIVIKNVKMFTSTENADGINGYNVSNLLVDNCYIQSADDCFCLYNSCDSIPTLFDEGYEDIKAVCKNVEFKNCILSTNCRPFVFGGHATGSKNPRCLIENIHIHDCEIISTPYRIFGNTEEYSMYWSGFMRILSQSEQIVRDIRFENIDVDVTKGHNGKIFHIEVRAQNSASYTESKGYRIENLLFKNINIYGNTDMLLPSIIKCRLPESETDAPCVKNIVFENVKCLNRNFDKAWIIEEGPVENVVIKKDSLEEMKYKAIIFDLDGVVVTTDKYHYLAWKKLADEINVYFDEKINNRLRGVSRMESLEIVLEKSDRKYSDEEKLEMAERKNNYYKALIENMDESSIIEGAVEFIETVKSNGVKVAIGSSSKNAVPILKKCGLYDTFDAIADGNDIKNSKPHPDVFLVAANKLGLNPNECLVAEDAVAGVTAGINAGMDVLAIGDAKKDTRAKYRFDSLKHFGSL